jgi:hypothetical protein
VDPVIGLVASSGWAAGLNLYLTTALLGLAGRFELLAMPEAITSTPVIGVALALFAIEFVEDKVPYLDSAWDDVHTVVRPVGAALIGYALTGDAGGAAQAGAAGGAGLLALASHAAKATVRAAANTSPEPFSNTGLSLGEDGLVAVVVWLAITNPLIALAVVAFFTVAGLAVTVAMWRFVRRRRRRTRQASVS